MKKIKLNLKEEYIRLDNLLKYEGITETGGQAKYLIQSGHVKLNGEVCELRGKKIHKGDIVELENCIIEVN